MKKIIAVLLCLLLVMAFAACSKSADDSKDPSEVTGVENPENTEKTNPGKGFDFSEMTVGKIKKISGNQVTLELGKIDESSFEKPEGFENFDPENMPEGMTRPENMPEGMSRPDKMPEGFDKDKMPKNGEKPENMPEMPADFDPSNMPEGFSFGGFSGGSFGSSFTAEVEYTGETARYTIPSEVRVGSGDYTSLSEGMVIALGFDEDGVVDSVMLITEKGTN